MGTPSPAGSRPAGDPTFTQPYVRARLGIPSASLNALIGHRSCAPEDYRRYFPTLRQGPAPVTASFRRVTVYTFWRLGFKQYGLCRITRVPRHAAPYASATAAGFLSCYFSLHLTDPGEPSDPRTPPPVRARCAGDTTCASWRTKVPVHDRHPAGLVTARIVSRALSSSFCSASPFSRSPPAAAPDGPLVTARVAPVEASTAAAPATAGRAESCAVPATNATGTPGVRDPV